MSGEPAEIIAKLAARDVHRLYVDGGLTIQRFLRAGCIDRIIITRVPILLGGGIPLFGTLARDLPLRHVSTKSYPSGLVQSEYVPVASASPE
jgi:dihydrofolate reductase